MFINTRAMPKRVSRLVNYYSVKEGMDTNIRYAYFDLVKYQNARNKRKK